jgi:hypothetical protein
VAENDETALALLDYPLEGTPHRRPRRETLKHFLDRLATHGFQAITAEGFGHLLEPALAQRFEQADRFAAAGRDSSGDTHPIQFFDSA